jgi:hypothetical protein
MYTRIALVAAPEMDLQAIRREFMNPIKFNLREFLSMDEVNAELRHSPFDVLMTRFQMFGSSQVAAVNRLRHIFPQIPLISLVRASEGQAVFESRNIVDHKVLYEDTELRDLAQVVEKMRRREISGVRLHPRIFRHGEADLYVMNPQTGSPVAAWKGRFVDFARMGARLAIQGEGRLQQGCKAQLHYRSSAEPSHIHRIETKVVWERSVGAWGANQHQVALRFIATL